MSDTATRPIIAAQAKKKIRGKKPPRIPKGVMQIVKDSAVKSGADLYSKGKNRPD